MWDFSALSDNACRPEERIAPFYDHVAACIHDHHDLIEVPIMVNLEVARKNRTS